MHPNLSSISDSKPRFIPSASSQLIYFDKAQGLVAQRDKATITICILTKCLKR